MYRFVKKKNRKKKTTEPALTALSVVLVGKTDVWCVTQMKYRMIVLKFVVFCEEFEWERHKLLRMIGDIQGLHI